MRFRLPFLRFEVLILEGRKSIIKVEIYPALLRILLDIFCIFSRDTNYVNSLALKIGQKGVITTFLKSAANFGYSSFCIYLKLAGLLQFVIMIGISLPGLVHSRRPTYHLPYPV